MKRLTFTLVMFLLIGAIGCEKQTSEPAPVNPEPEQPTPTPDPEPEPGQPDPVPYPVPDATYEFKDYIAASVYSMETNGLRNDYVSFFNEVTSEALYIDFYASLDNGYLPSGTYILGDGSVNTCAQEYTYLALIPNGDLQRFVEGKATVNADAEHDSGYVWYHITAYFTLPNGETVSLDYEGQLIEK